MRHLFGIFSNNERTRLGLGFARWSVLLGGSFLAALPIGLAWAEEPLPRLIEEFSVSHWGTDDGLPELAVVSVGQSRDGFVWCFTPNHLLIFDGLRFEDCGQLDSGSAQMPYPIFFRGSVADAAGTPWIFGQRGAMRRSPEGWRRPDSWQGASGIVAMVTDADGVFWAVSEDSVWRIDGDELVASSRRLLPDQPQRIISAAVNPAGGLLLGGNLGLYRFANDRFEPITVPGIGRITEVSALSRERAGDWWVCCRQGLLRQREGVWEQIALPFPPGQATQLIEDREGSVWVGTKQGLYRYGNRSWSELTTRDVPHMVNVLSLAEDDQKHIWAGTSEGLLCLRPKLVKVLFAQPRQGRQTITSVVADGGSNVWVGSLNDGLLRVRGNVLAAAGEFKLPPGVKISTLGVSRAGGLWVGTVGDHLFHLEAGRDNRFIEVKKSAISAREITTLAETDVGSLWVGTWQGVFGMTNAAVRENPAACLEPVLMPTRESGVFSPVLSRVTALAPEADGSLWIGFDGLKVLRQYPDAARGVFGYGWGLPDGNVRMFHRDGAGRLWAGTSHGLGLLTAPAWQKVLETNGLFSKNTEQRTRDRTHWQQVLGKPVLWQSASKAQGLAEPDIRQIIEDHHGRIWLGTRNGIQVFSRGELEAVLDGRKASAEGRWVGIEDGMESEECTLYSSPGVARDGAGRLYFATMDGLVMANPAHFESPTNPAPVFIQQVTAGDALIYKREGNSPISLPVDFRLARRPGIFSLPQGRRDVNFNFATPVYDAPNRLRFRWRLEGVDTGWSAPATERKAAYPRLAPGDYTFRVQAVGQGGWQEVEEPFRFRVRPYFYEMPLVQLAAGLCLAVAVGAGVWRWERQRSRRRMQQLERGRALERERARIARDLHDELGVGLTEIGLLGDVVAATPTEAKANYEVAGEISGRARGLAAALDEIVWAISPANDNSLSLGDYFSSYAQSLLQRAGLACQIDVATGSRDARINVELRHQLFLAFKEALNNVLIHARATEVRIRIALEASRLTIRVADNGCGIGPAATSGSPDGLRSMRERLAQIGGDCEIQSVPAGGTTVIFTLPVETKGHP